MLLLLDRFESSGVERCGDVFSSDNEKFELTEVELGEFGFVETGS